MRILPSGAFSTACCVGLAGVLFAFLLRVVESFLPFADGGFYPVQLWVLMVVVSKADESSACSGCVA